MERLRCDNIKLSEDDILVICLYEKSREVKVVGHCRLFNNGSRIYYLYTHPQFRNRKIADLLITYAASLSLAMGNKKIYGSCKKELIPMYERYGMRVTDGPDEKGEYQLETDLPSS